MRPGAHPLRVQDDDARVVRQRIDQGLHALDQGRGQGFHPFHGDPVGHLGQHVRDPWQFIDQRLGPRPHVVRQQDFPTRRRPHTVTGYFERPLVGHLEPADLFDRVPPELDPQRVVVGG